jgi:hypothetical protein
MLDFNETCRCCASIVSQQWHTWKLSAFDVLVQNLYVVAIIKLDNLCVTGAVVEHVWNVMAHAQKPDLVFQGNGRVHLNRRGSQFSWLLAAEVCASAVVMVVMPDTPCSEVVKDYWLPTPLASFPFTSPPVRHRVPSGFNWAITHAVASCL